MRRLRLTDRAEPDVVKRRRPWTWLGVAGLLGTLGGCTCEAPPERAGSTVPSSCAYDAPLFAPVETDILFVVDDSNSMSEEQEGVARELPTFVQILQTGAGVQQNLRVGLVNTSVYSGFSDGRNFFLTRYPQGGWLRTFPAADGGVGGGERWLTDPDPEIASRLSAAIRRLGINGSFQETPFEAARIALTGTGFWTVLPDGGNPNAGFLRPGARLLVVAVSDEDDCSQEEHDPPSVFFTPAEGQDFCTLHEDMLTPVGDYVTALQRLDGGTGRPREVLWGAIAPVARSNKAAQGIQGTLGDGGPVIQNVDCPTSGGPGYRHRQMALAFDPTLTNLDSVCAPDYHQSLVVDRPGGVHSSDVDPDGQRARPAAPRGGHHRADGSVQRCTLANGGIVFVPGDCHRAAGGETAAALPSPADGHPGRGEAPLRRLSDAHAPVHPVLLTASAGPGAWIPGRHSPNAAARQRLAQRSSSLTASRRRARPASARSRCRKWVAPGSPPPARSGRGPRRGRRPGRPRGGSRSRRRHGRAGPRR